MRGKKSIWQLGLLLAMLVLAMLVLFWRVPPTDAAAGINKQISFQGKIVNSDGTNVADASYTFVFSIYTVDTAGVAVWTESKSIAVADGIFQTNLGSVTALPGSVDFNSDTLYLGIEFNSDGEMTPRVRLAATPYAFNADQVDGLDATDMLRSNASDTFSGSNDQTLTIESSLTAAARTADLLYLSQANDVTYNQTAGSLLHLNQADTGSSINPLYIQNAGSGAALLFEAGTTVADGLQFGTDANLVTLYRSANDTLKTDDSLVVGNALNVTGTTTLATSLTGVLTASSGVVSVGVADTDYQQPVTWGDGLAYSAPTASVDYNTTNLKITASQLDTIQGISTAAAPTFANITDSGLTAGRVTYAGTAGILQDSATLTFGATTGLVSNITSASDSVTYGIYAKNLKTSANTGDVVGLYALGQSYANSDITVGNVVGIQTVAAPVVSEGTGTITNVKGLEILNSAAAFGTNRYALYINDVVNSTNNYGIYFANNGTNNNITWYNASGNTNLYSSAANTLKTDDSLIIAGTSVDLLTQGDLRFYDADSSNYVGFQSPATVGTSVLWTLPSADGGAGECLSTNAGTLSWASCGGGSGAPTTAEYVTLALDGTLSAERVLTGTANQIVVADNGANSTVVLSTPQDIGTASNVQFAGITATGIAALDGGITVDTNNFTVSGSTGAVGLVAAQTTGTTLGVSYDVATQTGALTGLAVDLTNLTPDATNAVYGIKLDDPASNTASVEYGIYQAGTNWDYGAYFDDLVRIADSGLVLGSTAVSSTAAELNILDGATLTVTEMNYLDGTVVTAGGVIFGNATYLANSGAGNTGELLTSAGTGTPTWTAQSSVNAGQLDSLDSTDFLRATASDTYEGSNDRTLTIQSALTAAARTANLVTISQANDATYDQTAGVLLNVSQADTASTTNVAYLQNAGAGYALAFEQGTTTADGIVWGADANLVTLYRSANDTLKTDDAFLAANLTSAGLTSGRVTYAGTAGILQDSANLTYDGTTFNHGVPTAALTGVIGASAIKINTTNPIALGAENTTASSSTQGAFVDLFSNDGAAMAAGDRLGGIIMGGSYSASAMIRSAAIAAFAENLWVDGSDYGTYLSFQTIAAGATLRTEKMRLTSAGHLLIEGVTSTGATGTGKFVFDTSPTLVTPALGAATYTTLSGGNITDSGLTAGRVTYAGTAGILQDSANMTFDTTNGLILAAGSTSALQLSSAAGTAVGGLLFGTDTNLYRSAANTLKTDDSLIVDGSLTVDAPTSTDYKFTSSTTAARLAIQSTATGQPNIVDLFTTDGDGTDTLGFQLYAKGTVADITTAAERLLMIYSTTNTDFEIASLAGGTGTVRPIKLYTGANSSQLVLNTDGTASFGDSLTVTNDLTVSGVNAAAGSETAATLSGTLGAFNGSDTFRGLYLNYTNADHTGSSNNFYGIDIAGITGDAQASEYVLNVGSGWDAAINLTAAASSVDFRSAKTDATGAQFLFNTSAAVTTASVFAVQENGTTHFAVNAAGSLIALATYSTTVGGANRDLFIDDTGKIGYVSSSRRFKQNIEDLTTTEWLYDLKPVSYEYIQAPGQRQIGLIAEDVAPIAQDHLTSLVSYNPQNPNEVDTVNYSQLVVPLLAQVQELNKRLTNNEVATAEFQSQLGSYLSDNTLRVDRVTSLNGDLTLEAASSQITVKGKLNVEEEIAGASLDLNDESAGQAVLEAGKSEVFIATTKVMKQDKIFFTPHYTTDNTFNHEFSLYRGDVDEGRGFTVNLVPTTPLEGDLTFDWLIVK